MINNLLFITSIIDEWSQKLDTLADKYLDNPSIGFVVFVGLLLFGFWAVANFSKK